MCWIPASIFCRTAVCLIEAQKEVQSNLHAVTCPVLTIHGDADRLCNVEGAHMVNTIAQSEDKTLQVSEHKLVSMPF